MLVGYPLRNIHSWLFMPWLHVLPGHQQTCLSLLKFVLHINNYRKYFLLGSTSIKDFCPYDFVVNWHDTNFGPKHAIRPLEKFTQMHDLSNISLLASTHTIYTYNITLVNTGPKSEHNTVCIQHLNNTARNLT